MIEQLRQQGIPVADDPVEALREEVQEVTVPSRRSASTGKPMKSNLEN